MRGAHKGIRGINSVQYSESVSYSWRRYLRILLPGRIWPPVEGRGSLLFVYQDAHRSQSFFSDQVRTVKVDDLGMVVSVTLVESATLAARRSACSSRTSAARAADLGLHQHRGHHHGPPGVRRADRAPAERDLHGHCSRRNGGRRSVALVGPARKRLVWLKAPLALRFPRAAWTIAGRAGDAD